MIRYSLKCDEGHRFDSWFASSADYDRLHATAMIGCAVCGTSAVAKDVMAPAVGAQTGEDAGKADASGPLSAPLSPAEQALAELRRRIEAQADNVGRAFPEEARRIHRGEAPGRPIIGEARPAEARALIEDGVPIAPLPWGNRKAN